MGVKNIKLINKILSILFIFVLIIPSFNISAFEKKNIINSDCFGFIIPLPEGKDTSNETFEIGIVRNLLNDFLREKIDVYWLSENITILSKKIGINEDNIEIFFNKGAFIIPFTGDLYHDALIISIINDYNSSSEILDNNVKVKTYLIMESILTRGYKLNEVKIAQHLGLATRYSWPCYLLIADAGGFLTFEFIDDFETSKILNNDDFNVFMWPYEPNPSTIFEVLRSLSDYKGLNKIRDFVSNGGGYIGSCYGAEIASAGFIWPFPVFYIKKVYNPNLKVLPFYSLALSDTWMRGSAYFDDLLITTSEIKNNSHPISFGLKDNVKEFFNGGWYKYVGSNIETIADYTNIETINEVKKIPLLMKKSLINSPSHISSTFGKGKVVEFTSHPEFIINISILFNNIPWEGDKYYGQRMIFNALNYVTSEHENLFYIEKSQNISFVQKVINTTSGITIDKNINTEFDELINKIELLKKYIDKLENKTSYLKSLYSAFDDKYEIFRKGRRHIGYIFHYCSIYDYFLNRSILTFQLLENVYPMYYNYNNIASNEIVLLKKDIQMRIENATKIIDNVFEISDKIDDIFQKNNINIIDLIKLISLRRNLISEYELNLKYIPQQYFNALKVLRRFWYNYEADIAQ